MIRKLTSLKVFLFFEKENIDTEHMSSELMLSILSSIAESESKSISQNSKWSIKNRFKAGTFIISYPPYGYENKDRKMNICPENEVLKYTTINREGYREYKSDSKICSKCKNLEKCTKSKNKVKVITRHIW